jgi:hypothetical protein
LTIVISTVKTGITERRYTRLMDENPVDREIAKIEAWLKASGMKESRLGLLACANARAVERVRNGSGSVESLRSIIDYITRNPAKAGAK